MTTPARLLCEIAWRGSRGISPFALRAQQGDSLRVLVDLGLVAQESNGHYVATTEKGFYPIQTRVGAIWTPTMGIGGTREIGHTSHFGRRKAASL